MKQLILYGWELIPADVILIYKEFQMVLNLKMLIAWATRFTEYLGIIKAIIAIKIPMWIFNIELYLQK